MSGEAATPAIEGLRFTLAAGESLSEERAQEALDSYLCPLDWTDLVEQVEWDGDESGVYSRSFFECGMEHIFPYDQERAVLEDQVERYAADARPFPIQCEHRGADRHPQQFVPWGVARRAYLTYSRLFGNGQTLERLAERAGFGEGELAVFLKAPKTHQEMDRLFAERRRA